MVKGTHLVQLGRSQGVKLQFTCADYRIKKNVSICVCVCFVLS